MGWRARCTVAEVRPKLKAELAYTTVQTMLNVLLRKGKVSRVQEGRAFRYKAAVNRQARDGVAPWRTWCGGCLAGRRRRC